MGNADALPACHGRDHMEVTLERNDDSPRHDRASLPLLLDAGGHDRG